MDLRSLNYFVAVYETGSFSAASKRKFIAQPSISASIKLLEQSLSQSLFHRYARGVTPTEAGHQLYPLAKQLLGQADAIQHLFIESPHKTAFRLGLIKGLGVERMSNLLKQFTSSVDSMELTLVPIEEHSDARIISQDLLDQGESFVPMWQEQYQLAIPIDHPLCLSDTIALENLSALPFIQRSPCEGWSRLRELLSSQSIVVDIRARIQTVEYAIGLVRAGLGCAFIPIPTDKTLQQDIAFRPLADLSLTRKLGLAFKESSPVIDILCDVIKN